MSQIKKEVNYLGRDFSQFRNNLIEFTKAYFPNTYNDFNESSPGMMIMEMSSYIGDVLSYYTDYQFKETLLNEAMGKANIRSIAKSLGYQSKNSVPAVVELSIYILLPAKIDGASIVPDYSYALTVNSGMVVSAPGGIEFRTVDPVNFAQTSPTSPTEVTVYSVNDTTKEPEIFLLKKKVNAVAGNIKTKTYDFTEGKRYDKILIEDTNIIDVVSITDSDENVWYEVPFLAQDTIFQSISNTRANDPEMHVYSDSAPSLLKIIKTPRRFITRFNSDNNLEIQFGSGVTNIADEEIIPNPDNIGSSLLGLQKQYDFPIDPSNFMYTKAYGLAPSNTTLTIKYTVGGGLGSNVQSNTITDILNVSYTIEDDLLDQKLLQFVKTSLAIINETAASGGRSFESIEEIRQNALAMFASQQRAVTKDDYIIRCYAMPPKFGSIAKVFATQDDNINTISLREDRISNPLAINLYTLGYTDTGKLTQLTPAIKSNLQTYMKQYRMLTDAVNIKDAFIINIGVLFDIITLPEFNSNEVLLKCIAKMKELFDVSKWKIGQPIITSKLYVDLDRIDGVQTVKNIEIVNLYKTTDGYSGNVYNIKEATRNGIIYTSLDPSIFEVKYPDADIVGKVVTL